MKDKPPPASIKGRGAAHNPGNRFEAYERERDAEEVPADEGDMAVTRPRTVITLQQARSIIARNDSPDVPFSQSINPYQGCEHGCIYCYARPTHAYIGLSPGLDFETKLFGKQNAVELLRKELARPGYKCELIALGANTDPYQPVEREQHITRGILEVLAEHHHPVGVVTKSALVERDIDILAQLAKQNLAHVFVSITSLDSELSGTLEPRATAPYRRVQVLKNLSHAGIPCGVLFAPVIPFINDKDLESVLEAAAEAGATMAGYVVLRLPLEVKTLFRDWLVRHFPLRAARVMARVNDLRGGRDYDSEFGSRMSGKGEYSALIASRFARMCAKHGLYSGERFSLDTSRFRVPGRGEQLSLL
jgi:DNA repair photolyase